MSHAAGVDERYRRNSLELGDRLQAASARAGDSIHTSGHADYVVRTLINYPDPEEHLPTDTSCFAIAVGMDGIQVITKRGSAHGNVIAEIAYDEGPWVDEIVRLFTDFRNALED